MQTKNEIRQRNRAVCYSVRNLEHTTINYPAAIEYHIMGKTPPQFELHKTPLGTYLRPYQEIVHYSI